MAYTTINKSGDYFNTKLYTGNGGTQTITGVGFQSDFTWFKSRSAANSHSLLDSIRGLGYALSSNLDGAQIAVATQTFNSDGYVLANDGGAPSVNPNGVTTAAWNWKANGTGVANTDGDIASTVSANTTSGFSIVTFTGNETVDSTVGHGLGAIPKMIIVKGTSFSAPWIVYHHSIGNSNYLRLNTTDAEATANGMWSNTTPTNSVFTLGTDSWGNNNGQSLIAYCFADVQGFSKIGSYTGNGSSDGTFCYTGMKPSWVLIKQTNSAGNDWWIYDNKRDTFNLATHGLRPNISNAEVNYSATDTMNLDLLSNGFKIKSTDGALNGNGSSYIYMAFAEAPLVGSNNVPCTAR